MVSTLRLRVEGEGKPVSFDSFVSSMNRALQMLRDVDRVISTHRTPALTWVVADLGAWVGNRAGAVRRG